MNDDERRRQLEWADRQNKIWGGPGLWSSGCLGSFGCYGIVLLLLALALFLAIYWLT